MKTVLFYYDAFSNFEVACAAFQFQDSLITAALEQRIYISEENMKMVPHMTISQINPQEVDLLIIPGGNPTSLFDNDSLKTFVQSVSAHGGVIAAICGGTGLLASLGLLNGKKCTGGGQGITSDWDWGYPLFKESIIVDEPVVVDDKIVTSTGQSFLEFSLMLNEVLGMYESEEERMEDRRFWLKET